MKSKRFALVLTAVLALGLAVSVAGCGGILGSSTTTTQASAQTPTQNQNGTTPSTAAPGQGQAGQGQRPGAPGGRLIAGTITASDASSVTIKTVAGGTQTVLLSEGTTITVTSEGTAADLVPGKTVAVLMTTDSNNTRSASQVHVGVTLPQVRDARRQGFGVMGRNVVFGTITASSDSSLTVQTANAGTQNVPLTSSTKIVVTRDGTATDLAAGKNVVIWVTKGANNSLTASQIQVGVGLAQARAQTVPQGRGQLVPPGDNGRAPRHGFPRGGYPGPGNGTAPQIGGGI